MLLLRALSAAAAAALAAAVDEEGRPPPGPPPNMALTCAAGSAEAVLSSRSSEHVSTNPEFGAYVKALGDTRPVAGADRSDVHETQYDEANLDMFKFCNSDFRKSFCPTDNK